MTSVSKDVYIDKLEDIVYEYNNTYHRTIKIKPVDIKLNTYIEFGVENNDKNPKFKVCDHAKTSAHAKFFAKGDSPNWIEFFLIKKVSNTVPWTYVIEGLYGKEIFGMY